MTGRCLGVDYGTHNVGLAISDETAMLASPLETIRVRDSKDAARHVAERCREFDVRRIVIGMPLNMNQSRGPSAEAAAALAKHLKEATGLPVIEWDERLTTRLAERSLIASNVRRSRRRLVVDQAAAQLILQSYLDSQDPFA